MSNPYDRRQVLKGVAAASASLLFPKTQSGQDRPGCGLVVAGQNVEVQVASVSAHTLRFTILPIKDEHVADVPSNGSLVQASWSEPMMKLREGAQSRTVKAGNLRVSVSTAPLAFNIETEHGEVIQHLGIDQTTGIVSFSTGNSPLLGLGEGGPQFDRRGSLDTMRSGQGGYQLGSHGGRVPIPWLIGTAGTAIYIHHPF